MNAINTKTFKSGNSVALRLPAALGVPENVEMTIERRGEGFVVMPARDPAEEKRKVRELVESLRALGPVGEIEKRVPPMPPIRRGL